jgi:GT2 family glycosyltransferase
VRLEVDWLEGLHDAYKKTNAGIVGGAIVLWWEVVKPPAWWSERLDSYLSTAPADQPLRRVSAHEVIGANFSFKRTVYEKVGPFGLGLDRSGKQLMGYGEIEWSERAQWAGVEIWSTPHAKLHHWVAPERVTMGYLKKVAWGNGYSRVMSRRRMTLRRWVRSIMGHIYLFARHGLASLGARIIQDHKRYIYHKLFCRLARGGLYGIVSRLVLRKHIPGID